MPMLHVDPARFAAKLRVNRRQRRARNARTLNVAALSLAACTLIALLVLAP